MADITHIAQMVEVEHLSDSALCVHIICCGDPTTEQRHTLYISDQTDADVQAWVAEKVTAVQETHSKKVKTMAFLHSLKAQVTPQ